MTMPARGTRSTPEKTPETESVPLRPRSAQGSPAPNQAISTVQQLQTLVNDSPKVQKLKAMAPGGSGPQHPRAPQEALNGIEDWHYAAKLSRFLKDPGEKTLSIDERQKINDDVLIERFGRDVGITMKLHKDYEKEQTSESESRDYLDKRASLPERLKQFYQEVDVANLDNIKDEDLNVLITMLSTGFAVTQANTKFITKILTNNAMQSRLENAIEDNMDKGVGIYGFIAPSEATESLSPKQTVAALGLDYSNADNGTDFLLKKETEEATTYEPIPQVSYMKIPYTKQLKSETKMVLDVRLYEKILERAQRAEDPQAPFSLKDQAITRMAKEISKSPISLKYKTSKDETPSQVESNIAKYKEVFKGHQIKAQDAPFTGLGFSAYGEKIGSGFMNMYPEMNISQNLTKDNYQKIMGPGNNIEFFAKFAKSDKEPSTNTPDGSVDVKVGTWDGEKVNIPWDAGILYEKNFNRVADKFLDNEEHVDLLIKNRLNIDKLKEKLVKKSALAPPRLKLNGAAKYFLESLQSRKRK